MSTPAPTKNMPTEDNVPEIKAITSLALNGVEWVYEVRATSGGVLVRYHRDRTSPVMTLAAIGYTVTVIGAGLVLVTGAVDRLALLEGQIAALAAERDALLEERRASELAATVGAL